MAGLLTPPRKYGVELLDSRSSDEQLLLHTVADLRCSNVVFQGTRAAVAELALHFSQLPKNATLLDVGTGLGDVPRAAARAARKRDIALTTIGLDMEPVLARAASDSVSYAVCGSGLTLPFGNASVDIAMCSQTLHHFRNEQERVLLREMNRVARVAVVVSDLRRSWLAAAGFWLASFPLQFHRITRHDGVLSVMRGYTCEELSDTVFGALGLRPSVHERIGFRVTTSWAPTTSCAYE
ncbi:MAG TPA: methyltransferase domain-containing protein [Gemmatimonadaceae bacterium]